MGKVADAFQQCMEDLKEIDKQSQASIKAHLDNIDRILKEHDRLTAEYELLEDELITLIGEIEE